MEHGAPDCGCREVYHIHLTCSGGGIIHITQVRVRERAFAQGGRREGWVGRRERRERRPETKEKEREVAAEEECRR